MRFSKILACICIFLALGYAISQETPRGEIQGQVLRATDGKPLAKAQIVLTGASPNEQASSNENASENDDRWFRTSTDENGQFLVRRVPAGTYQVAARAPRFAADETVTVGEGNNNLKLELQRVYPQIPPAPIARDPEALRIRTLDIVRARYNLTPELYRIIRDNNQSGLPLPVVLAQAGAESSFRPQLIGAAGEVGLFQIQITTANDQGLGTFTAEELLDPALNTQLATTYLRRLHDQFGNLRTALAAYNQGPGNTLRRGLFLEAQIYSDAILRAAWHDLFQQRLREIE